MTQSLTIAVSCEPGGGAMSQGLTIAVSCEAGGGAMDSHVSRQNMGVHALFKINQILYVIMPCITQSLTTTSWSPGDQVVEPWTPIKSSKSWGKNMGGPGHPVQNRADFVCYYALYYTERNHNIAVPCVAQVVEHVWSIPKYRSAITRHRVVL